MIKLMEDLNIKSIRYPMAVDAKLESLSLKFGRSKKLFFEQMVDYFHKSKKDPTDLNDEVLKKELSSGVSRIISFVRKLESDFLLPVFSNSGKLLGLSNTHSKFLEGLSQYAVNDETQTGRIIAGMMLLEKAIVKTQTNLDEKAVLKTKFSKILERYINSRESLGWTDSSAKKEELQGLARESLKNI
ncbi:BfmA/BtgA family mobilization protein [Pedobacter polysacchareus]|uniref:BfmA/BtgA family mobilization protein n=1 Tax=Pedobacter polysacchareus TaxID=2861973 RepID=UPI001C990F94|nr:BfmA/BtgA family mobilization protein [Pedobacter polysacchareus]